MSEENPHDTPVKRKKRFVKPLLLLGICVFLIASLLMMFKSLNGPAEGTVSVSTIQDDTANEVPLKPLIGTFYSTKYPGRYELQSSSKNSASLEAWLLVARQAIGIGPSGVISMTVATLPPGGVKEDGAYKQFEAFKNLYTLTTRNYSGEEVIVADRTETNFEHTVLWPHNEYLLTMSMTSPVKNDVLLAEFETILSSLVWNQ